MQSSSVTKISDNDKKNISGYLRNILSGNALGGTFIFRRVSKVIHSDIRSVKVVTDIDEYKKYDSLSLLNTRADQITTTKNLWERYVEVDCDKFHGFVNTQSIREEPNWIRSKSISFGSDRYRSFNPETLEFSVEKSKPPVPVFGDLLCIFMSSGKLITGVHKHTKQVADYWFVASEQFLRMWTAVMYNDHDSLWALVPKNTTPEDFEVLLRKKLFSGNQLATNTWLKYKMMGYEGVLDFTKEESKKLYWHLRTDELSTEWVDVCAVLVLLSRYGELPSKDNTPILSLKNGEVETVYRRSLWHIPTGLLAKIFQDSNCVHFWKVINECPCNECKNLEKICQEREDNISSKLCYSKRFDEYVYSPSKIVPKKIIKEVEVIAPSTSIQINIVGTQQDINISIKTTAREQLFSMKWD